MDQKRMTATQFQRALKDLGLGVASQRTALLLGLSIRQCQRLASGEQPVPRPVERLLKMYQKFGTDEQKVSVRCGSEFIEAIEIDPSEGAWDVSYPWGIERFNGDADEVVRKVRDRFKQRMAADA